MEPKIAKALIIVGLLLLITGLAFYFFAPYLRWIGRLPGDIRIERGNTRIYIPITSMLLLSLVLSLLWQVLRRWM